MSVSEDMQALDPIKDSPIDPMTVMASLALNLALKWHDTTVVKDGVLYQQYKMEGKNMEVLHLDMVFETAARIEAHLLGAPARMSGIILKLEAMESEPTAGEP